MSWIFGIYSGREITEDERRALIGDSKGRIVRSIEQKGLFAALGGIPSLCFHAENLLVSGIALRDFEPVTIDDWKQANLHPDFDGQYCGLRMQGQTLTLFCDHFNHRPFYLWRTDDAIVFSTDREHLRPFMKNPRLDMDAIASFWLSNGQYHYRSFVKDLIRSQPASVITITPDLDIRHCAEQWLGLGEKPIGIDIEAALDKTIRWFAEREKISMGLSGGTDSRLILAYMMQHRDRPWRVHTFGERDNPEVVIADRIARELKLNHLIVEPQNSDPDTVIQRSRQIASQTEMTYSIRAYRTIDNLRAAVDGGYMILDGDYGCFIRDYFLNGIRFKLKSAPKGRKFEKLYELTRVNRVNFFPDPLYKRMNDVAWEDFQKLPGILKEWDGKDYTALLALLHTYYRYPNLVRNWNLSLEITPLISPLGQASIVRELLRMPVSKRANCRVSYPILKKLEPRLMRFPLVRYGTTVPFWVYRNYLASGIIANIKRRRGLTYHSDRTFVQLEAMKGFVRDVASSNAVKECEYYDYSKVSAFVNSYYDSPTEAKGGRLMQWLGFELFRQSVEDQPSSKLVTP